MSSEMARSARTWHVKQDGNVGRPAGRVASHSAISAVVGVHTKHVRPLQVK